MLCDYIVLIFLGLARKDLTRTTNEISAEGISQFLSEIAKHCDVLYHGNLPQQAYLPRDIQYNGYQPMPPYPWGYKKYKSEYNYKKPGSYLSKVNDVKVPGYKYDPSKTFRRHYVSPSDIDVSHVNYVNEQPNIGGSGVLRNTVTFDRSNGGDVYLKVPKQKVLSLISREQLDSLYNEKLAYDVPTNDPLEPEQVAISALFIENLLKMKSGFEEGVYGASKIFTGVLGVGGGLLGLLKDGAGSIGKMLLTKRG